MTRTTGGGVAASVSTDTGAASPDRVTESKADKARSAVVLNFAFNLFRDVLQFAMMLVLVRLVEPAAYGLFALTTSITTFLLVFSFQSFTAHSMQVVSDAETLYHMHFNVGLIIQGGLFFVTLAVAYAASNLREYALVAPLLACLSVSWLLDLPSHLRQKMLERDFNWRRLRTLHAIGLLMSAATAIAMAWAGAGVYALALPGMLVTLPFIWDLLVVAKWRPRWSWPGKDYADAFRFGSRRMLSGMAVASRPLLETSVLTVSVGFGMLGLVNRATGLATMICQRPAQQLMYTLYPLLPRAMDPQRALAIATLLLRVVVWSVVPLAVALAVLRRPVVELLYGSGWTGVLPFIPWTLAIGVCLACSAVASNLLLARNRAGLVAAFDWAALAGTAVALPMLGFYGVIGFLIATSIWQAFVLGGQLLAAVRVGALGMPGVGSAILPCGAGIAVAYTLSSLVFPHPYGAWTCLGWAALFSLAYLAVLRACFRGALAELVRHLPLRRFLERALFL